MKILIIDDSLMDRKLLGSVLKKASIPNPVLEAVNGEEGLTVLGNNVRDICLILLDWQMPVMDGLEFMKAAMKVPDTASIPIVMITASGSEENKKQVRDVNPNLAGYIVKPFKAQTLIDTITPFLR
jgi:two-component system, chemotaxis family, chemotaxis protein CheY